VAELVPAGALARGRSIIKRIFELGRLALVGARVDFDRQHASGRVRLAGQALKRQFSTRWTKVLEMCCMDYRTVEAKATSNSSSSQSMAKSPVSYTQQMNSIASV
jgi:hypothetical protein